MAEHDLRDRALAWSQKEKHFEIQAHLNAQERLSQEHEELLHSRLALQVFFEFQKQKGSSRIGRVVEI